MSTALHSTPEPTRSERALTLFAFFWAGAALFHRAQFSRWASSELELAESFFALLVLLRPQSLPTFLGLVVLQLVQISVLLPHISNHTLLLWFMALSIVLSAIVLAARGTLRRDTLYRSFAPALRIELLILYFWVVFHKLNPEFFDAPTSCAGILLDKLGAMLGMGEFPAWSRTPAVWGTLLTETAIPLLLISRRTRWMGIAVGMVFHLSVGLAVFFDFSSLVFACYALFIPETFSERLERFGRRIGAVSGALLNRWWTSWLLAATLLGGILMVVDASQTAAQQIAWLLWWVWGFGTTVLFAAATPWRATGVPRAGTLLDLQPRWLLIVPLLVFLNGASPHLGFKTEHSFAMFSNLRTEGGESNHYLLPVSLQVFDYQREIVSVESNGFNGRLLWSALRNRVSAAGAAGQHDIWIRLERNGQSVEIPAAERHPELSRPYPFPLSKMLWFREIVTDPTQRRCRH